MEIVGRGLSPPNVADDLFYGVRGDIVQKKLPARKHPRLKEYDYSQNGCYHITICTQNNQPLLSKVIVGRGLAPAEIKLSSVGKVAEEQLLALPKRYPFVNIDKYIIIFSQKIYFQALDKP